MLVMWPGHFEAVVGITNPNIPTNPTCWIQELIPDLVTTNLGLAPVSYSYRIQSQDVGMIARPSRLLVDVNRNPTLIDIYAYIFHVKLHSTILSFSHHHRHSFISISIIGLRRSLPHTQTYYQ